MEQYHRLARTNPRYEGWKLPVVGVITLALYFGVVFAMVIAIEISAFMLDTPSLVSRLDEPDSLNIDARHDPFMLAFAFGSIALMLPALLVSAWLIGPRPPRFGSVRGGLRWGWLARMCVVSLAVFSVFAAVTLLWGGDIEALDATAWASVAVVLLVTPFQSAAEEYVFRGYLFQLIGSWVRRGAVVAVIALPMFVLGHAYGIWGMIDVGLFAVAASWLVLRTGGLEASIAMHAGNNITLVLLEVFGVIDADSDTGANAWYLIPTILLGIVFIGLVELWMRRAPDLLGDDLPDQPLLGDGGDERPVLAEDVGRAEAPPA